MRSSDRAGRGAWPGRDAGGAQGRTGVTFRRQQQVEERILLGDLAEDELELGGQETGRVII